MRLMSPTGTVKRGFDVVTAAVALVVLAPIAAVIGLAIRVTMGSPVLFRQTRPGLVGQPFELMKFRTMLAPADEDDEDDDEVRLTRLGRRLRATSLDEIPQLVNVLRGELSLVGPRPLLTEYLPLYDAEQARRHDVRPGLTGLAQIHGRSCAKMEERFVHDVYYVDHWSPWLDLIILAKTVSYVLFRRDTGDDGAPTLPAWTGNGDRGAVVPPGPPSHGPVETAPASRGTPPPFSSTTHRRDD